MQQKTIENGHIIPSKKKAALIGFLFGVSSGALSSLLVINLASAHDESSGLTAEKKIIIVSIISFFVGAILAICGYLSPTLCAQPNYETSINENGELIVNGFTFQQQQKRIEGGYHPYLLSLHQSNKEERSEADPLIGSSINNGPA